jgi:hypothetical protein
MLGRVRALAIGVKLARINPVICLEWVRGAIVVVLLADICWINYNVKRLVELA